MIVGAAFYSQLNTNDQLVRENAQIKVQNELLRTQIDTSDREAECRSRAALFKDTQRAVADNLVARGLAALGRGESTEPYAQAVQVAADNVDTALVAQAAAIGRCSEDPDYEISPEILSPVPTITGD